jgi:hypothetical protein
VCLGGRFFRRTLWDLILEGAGNMVREEARRTLLMDYDKWAKDHPDDATKRGGVAEAGFLRAVFHISLRA